MIENLEFKELPLNTLNNFKSTHLSLNADPIYDFEDESDYNKYAIKPLFLSLSLYYLYRSGKLFDIDGQRCGYFNFDDTKFWKKLDELIETVTALQSD